MKHRLWIVCALPACLLAAGNAAADDEAGPILRRFVDEFVALTPGTGKYPAKFTMGTTDADGPAAAKPARVVQMTYPFAIARYEVTQELYQTVVGANPSRWKGVRNAIEMVNWEEATAFCQKATAELRRRKLLGEDEIIRLPTEAEWEYACRAGTATRYSFGDRVEDLKDYCWYRSNSPGEDPPVGQKKPNPWGLYDMHGYNREWCLDAWHPTYENAPGDSRAWDEKDAKMRVVRSGSWADEADRCTSAARLGAPADQRTNTTGFRCVRIQQKGDRP